MEIVYEGQSCVRLSAGKVAVLTDPFRPADGTLEGNAAIVAISQDAPQRTAVEAVPGQPYVIRGPGEYEIDGVQITGIAALRDEAAGPAGGRTTIYSILIDGLHVCVLGALGQVLGPEQVAEIGPVDVLLVPVADGPAVQGRRLDAVIGQLRPVVLIPTEWAAAEVDGASGLLQGFLTEHVAEAAPRRHRLSLTRADLPHQPEAIVLLPRAVGKTASVAGVA
jgi:L-ascorbate metabolism protein UlaG (beta-lactamase superfamily)